jgi:hypothetical protein
MKIIVIKNFLTSWSKNNFLKFNLLSENKNKFSFDINFKEKLNNENEIFYENNKITSNKQLVISGLNWKLIKAADIYFILKPFENHLGGIKRVSIFTYTSILKMTKSCSKNDLEKFDLNYKKIKKKKIFFRKNKKYLAHIDCDSEETMKYLFKQCNGLEIGVENQIIDMRIINLNSLKKLFLIESVENIPSNFKPGFLKNELQDKKINAFRGKKEKILTLKIKKENFNFKYKYFKEKFLLKNSKLFYFYIFIRNKSFLDFKSNVLLKGGKILCGKPISKKLI